MRWTIDELLNLISQPNQEKCRFLWREHGDVFSEAWGSSNNHQAWEGGYVDHVRDAMNCAVRLYPVMNEMGKLPFSLGSALLVLFLHDVEKPWKPFPSKLARAEFRAKILMDHRIEMTPEEQNAFKYVEGEGDDYSGERRVMNELAAFCHMCDVASARIWHGADASSKLGG